MRYQNLHLIYLFSIIPISLIFIYIGILIKQSRLKRFVSPSLWKAVVPNRSLTRRFWKRVLFMIALCLVIIALLRPQYGTRFETVIRRGQDILIVLDTSLSMLAEDIQPNRFERAKLEIRNLIEELKGDRIGLLAFSGSTFMQCPLTLDYAAVKLFLEDIHVGSIPTPGSNLAQAIKVSRSVFSKGATQSKVMIILTDGEAFENDPIESTRIAAKMGVKIFTIGIGTSNGEPIPLRDDHQTITGYKKSKADEVILSKLNESVLKEIASITRGIYLLSGPGGLVSDKIYKEISRFEKQKLEEKLLERHEDRYQLVLLFAFIFLFIEWVISEQNLKRKPWRGRIQ